MWEITCLVLLYRGVTHTGTYLEGVGVQSPSLSSLLYDPFSIMGYNCMWSYWCDSFSNFFGGAGLKRLTIECLLGSKNELCINT